MADRNNDSIVKEIEAKKKKLAELQQRRLLRSQKSTQISPDDALSATTSPAPTKLPGSVSISPLSATPLTVSISPPPISAVPPPPSTDDVLSSVNSLIGTVPKPAASPPRAPPKPKVSLSIIALPSIDIPGTEKIFYDVGVQTTDSYLVSAAAEKVGVQSTSTTSTSADDEEDELRLERDRLRIREADLVATIQSLQSQLKEKETNESSVPPILTPGQVDNIIHSNDFNSFFSRTSLLVERMLSARDNKRGLEYDFTIDYTAEDADPGDGGVTKEPIILRSAFTDNSKTLQRPVSSLDFSPSYPELLLASYASLPTAEDIESSYDSPLGCVLLWNLHLTTRPERHFTADSAILSSFFHPTHPKLLIGATHTGQLLMWDQRSKNTPINRTSLATSHTQPIYACNMLPAANGSYVIVSVSSDGQTCIWSESNWHMPTSEMKLHLPNPISTPTIHSSHDELTVSCMDVPPRDSHSLYCGSEEGNIYKVRLHESSLAMSMKERVGVGLNENESIYESISNAHDAPITSLSFQPLTSTTLAPPHLSSSLFLTSSYDWTVKLWSTTLPMPLYIFESSKDYVHNVSFHPTNPALWASVDATGKMEVWNMAGERGGVENPQVSIKVKEKEAAGLGSSGTISSIPKDGVTSTIPASSTTPRTSVIDTSTNDSSINISSGPALSRVRWNSDGSIVVCGSSMGQVSVFDVESTLTETRREDQEKLWDRLSQRLSTGGIRM